MKSNATLGWSIVLGVCAAKLVLATTVISIRTEGYVLLAVDGLASGVPADKSRVCKILKVDRTIGDPLWYSLSGPAHPALLALISGDLKQCSADINACLEALTSGFPEKTPYATIVITDARHLYLLELDRPQGHIRADKSDTLRWRKGHFIFGEVSAIESDVRRIGADWPDDPSETIAIVKELLMRQVEATPLKSNGPIAILLLTKDGPHWEQRGACEK